MSLGDGNAGDGSKFFTSPAICVANGDASNDVILSMPHWPVMRFCQNVSSSWPSGVTTPRPVTTTRRSEELFAMAKSNEAVQACVQPKLPRRCKFAYFAFSSTYL